MSRYVCSRSLPNTYKTIYNEPMKKILYTRKNAILWPLRKLIMQQDHKTLAQWSIDVAPIFLAIFEQTSIDPRPRQALDAAKAWAYGEIKMPTAKKAAHATHNAATELVEDLAACAAARTMGHVVGTVHVETHAIGVAMYGLTAVFHNASKDKDIEVEKTLAQLYDRLLYWQANIDSLDVHWAPFLLKKRPNKEWLLYEKEQQQKNLP